jgi:hypothetical protein
VNITTILTSRRDKGLGPLAETKGSAKSRSRTLAPVTGSPTK